MAYTVGRPREYDLNEMAKSLIEWAAKPDSLNLNKFCAIHGVAPPKISLWCQQSEEFREAYHYAKAYIGARREEKLTNNELHVKAYDLNAATYDYFLKEERRLQAEFESKLKVQTDVAVNDAISQKYDQFMDMIKGTQERNIADSNSNNEQKS